MKSDGRACAALVRVRVRVKGEGGQGQSSPSPLPSLVKPAAVTSWSGETRTQLYGHKEPLRVRTHRNVCRQMGSRYAMST